MTHMTLSTAFSGVGAPEHATDAISAALCQVCGVDLVHIPTLHAIEKDRLARSELMSRPHRS